MNKLYVKALTMMLDPQIDEKFQWVNQVSAAIRSVLMPILIVVAAAGTIYAVVLGVNMARADSAEKREEAKKRVVNVLIGMVIIIALILLFNLFIDKILGVFIGSNGETA